jgi:hypothetical protein
MRCATLAVSLAVVLSVASTVQADVITSSSFTFRYGVEGSGPNYWTATENSGTNSPTTQGSFTLSPAPSGGHWSNSGPTFVGGTLADGTETSGNQCGDSAGFSLPITASYNGAAPGPGPYALKVEITGLSIYGCTWSGAGNTTLALEETTASHAQASSTLSGLTVYGYPDNTCWFATTYKQLVWDPGDYEVSLAGLNSAVTRTFDIVDGNTSRLLDGLEITGRVSLIYGAVPEPGAVTLLATGLIGLLAYAWRKRR